MRHHLIGAALGITLAATFLPVVTPGDALQRDLPVVEGTDTTLEGEDAAEALSDALVDDLEDGSGGLLDESDVVDGDPADLLADADPPGPVAPVVWTARARVTSYAPGCGDSGLTRSGTRPGWGTVAVDPRVVPLGSRLLIEGFDDTVFTALDTGSGVLGWHVDVWMSSCAAARRYGAQQRAVRVL